jgi:hypothetical protein
MNKQIKKHEYEYYHIPKLKGNPWFIPLTFVFGVLSYLNFKLILYLWKFLDLGYVFAKESELINFTPKFVDLVVCYPLIFEYIFISLTIICLIGVFKKLNSYDEKGLIYGLILGLFLGLIGGFVIGLIGGLIGGLICGVICGFLSGVIGGLIAGLFAGLCMEFG